MSLKILDSALVGNGIFLLPSDTNIMNPCVFVNASKSMFEPIIKFNLGCACNQIGCIIGRLAE